jgi:ribosomal protein S3AE
MRATNNKIVEEKMAIATFPFLNSSSISTFFNNFLSMTTKAITPMKRAKIVKIKFIPKLNSDAYKNCNSIYSSNLGAYVPMDQKH